jgi:GNAT superfamily N-acetyltransferase
METIQRLDFCSLDPYRYSLYEKMTAEKFRCYLHNTPFSTTSLDPIPLSFGVERDGEPIAVGHLTLHTNNTIGELHTFFIRDGYRCNDTNAKLLKAIEEGACQEGCRFLSFLYPKGSPLTPILQARGWSAPNLFMFRIDFDPPTFNTPWINKEYPLPEGCALFPWKELTAKEREALQRQEQQCRFHFSVSPFGDERYQQPVNSIGLRYNGEVVGWMITHTFPENPDTVRYSCLYIDDALHFKGLSIRLLQEAIRIQIDHSPYLWAYCEVNMGLSEPSWIRFLNRRLAPYCASLTKTMQSVKIFNGKDLS